MMMRQAAMIGFNRFFSPGAASRVASSRAGLKAMVETLAKKPTPIQLKDAIRIEESIEAKEARKAKEFMQAKEYIKAKEPKEDFTKELREMTQEERDNICALLEEASRRSTYY